MGSFKPPKLPAGLPPEARAALDDAFSLLYSDLKAIERSEGTLEVRAKSYRPIPGESVRVSPPAAGMQILLPAPDANNRGSQISIFIENPEGELRVFVAPNLTNDATVNGAEMVSFTAEGLVLFESNGINRWQSIEAFSSASPGATALDAEYVLGAAHGSLPNGRVATDSAEVDAVLTTPNLISWALNVASVAFSKLANLAGLSVLGRAASSSGVMAAITATAGDQHLVSNAAGTSLQWVTNRSQQWDSTVSGTLDPHLLDVNFKSGDSLVWVITGNTTLNRIRMSDDSVPPDGTTLSLSLRDQSGSAGADAADGNITGYWLDLVDTGAVTTDGSIRTPGQIQGTSPGPNYRMRSEEEGCTMVCRAGNWRLTGGTAAQAITGDILVGSGGGSVRTSAIAAGVIVNADINASAAIALSKLATQAAETFNGNFTAGSAVPTARAGSSIAGGGLTYTAGGTLAVGAGTGITVNANDVAVTIPLTDGDKGDITVASSGTSWTIDSGTITAAKVAVISSGAGALVYIYASFAAGGGGSADDVTVYSSNAPFAFRILKTHVYIATAVGAASIQARTATAGGGSALSSLFDAATATEAPAITTSITATVTVAANGSLFLRRSDSGIAGEFVFLCAKT